MVHEVNQRVNNALYHQIASLMTHLHNSMMVCDDIERRTLDVTYDANVLGAAAKYVAIADEAFNSCKTMAVAYMMGLSMNGHYFYKDTVFHTVKDMANAYQRYFTTLYSKVMQDPQLRFGYTFRVYDAYRLKV